MRGEGGIFFLSFFLSGREGEKGGKTSTRGILYFPSSVRKTQEEGEKKYLRGKKNDRNERELVVGQCHVAVIFFFCLFCPEWGGSLLMTVYQFVR